MNKNEILNTYVNITGEDITNSLKLLEINNWNLEKVLNSSNNSEIVSNDIREPIPSKREQIVNNFDIETYIQHDSFYLLKQTAKKIKKNILLFAYLEDDFQYSKNKWDTLNQISKIKEKFIIHWETINISNNNKITSLYNIYEFPFIGIISFKNSEMITTFKDDLNQDLISKLILFSNKKIIENKPIVTQIKKTIKLKSEPEKKIDSSTPIKFSYVQNNSSINRYFLEDDNLEQVYLFVENHFKLNPDSYKLYTRFPKKNLKEKPNKTIKQLGLQDSMIIVDSNL